MARGSDSEDFASADEELTPQRTKKNPVEDSGWQNDDDWEDFDVPESQTSPKIDPQPPKPSQTIKTVPPDRSSKEKQQGGDGWDDFDDWEQTNTVPTNKSTSAQNKTAAEHSEVEYKQLADKLSSLGGGQSNTESGIKWGGWGTWGVSNIISGVSQISSHVSQGFASVSQAIESGMGIPDAAELAKSSHQLQKQPSTESTDSGFKKSPSITDPSSESTGRISQSQSGEFKPDNQDDSVFKIGKLVSSMTKLVETTGTAVVTGGIDTLEEIGKRTIRVLQGEDEGKKRISALLRENRQENPPPPDEVVIKKKAPQFEALFDDYQGLVHLEALEMLSKQCEMKIQNLLSSHEGQELDELKETLGQVKDICELPDPDDEDLKNDDTTVDAFKTRLIDSVSDMGVQLQFDAIVNCWKNILERIGGESDDVTEEEVDLVAKSEDIMNEAVKDIAQSSALSVQLLQRATALLSVRERRSTADEADGLTQLTTVLSSHIGDIAGLYSQRLNQLSKNSKDSNKINEIITTVFLESGKGSTFIRDAFALTIPILQVGAT